MAAPVADRPGNGGQIVYATQPVSPSTDVRLSVLFEERIPYFSERVAHAMDELLPQAGEQPERLHKAMRYAVFNGGKRIRPMLVYATGECLAVDASRLDTLAAAIEFIHTFSLVHDDLPAMDDDDLRRGQPTVHKRFDEATAILAADALQPLAFAVISGMGEVATHTRANLVKLIADACGSMGMTGGQAIDLAAEGKELRGAELECMYALKTGALIRASILSVCLLADGTSPEYFDALDEFSRDIGIAFQIKDDILDVEGLTEVIGKTAGSDERLRKATYPALFGIDASHKRCAELLADGLDHLAPLGKDADPLRWLADYMVSRGS